MNMDITVDIYSLERIEELVRLNGGKYLCCDKPIKPKTIKCYEHTGGVRVSGYMNPQWVYFKCNNCDYNSGLNKVLNNIEIRKEYIISFCNGCKGYDGCTLNAKGNPSLIVCDKRKMRGW